MSYSTSGVGARRTMSDKELHFTYDTDTDLRIRTSGIMYTTVGKYGDCGQCVGFRTCYHIGCTVATYHHNVSPLYTWWDMSEPDPPCKYCDDM